MREFICNKCGDSFTAKTARKCPACLSRDILDTKSEEAAELRLIQSIEVSAATEQQQ